jgi:actin-like ATPase involved in cell morphogenesis
LEAARDTTQIFYATTRAALLVSEATDSMVVDIGGGTTEVGVIRSVVSYTKVLYASAATSSEAIVNYIRRTTAC